MKTPSELQDYFKKAGLKNTKQRQWIYQTIELTDHPISAEQLHLSLATADATINLSTVYRILDVFVSHRLISKTFKASENKALYEIMREEHRHYLICTSCKVMTPLTGCPLHTFESELSSKLSYIITGHSLEIFGICPTCQPQE